MPQPNLQAFAQTFSQFGALTLNNLLPEELANNMHEELDSLDWVLQVKDYSDTARFEMPLSEVPNRDNLVEMLYSKKHDIDLDKLFYIRLAVDSDKIKSESLNQISNFLNTETFINNCKQITGIQDITHSVLEATCYDKGCFLGNHCDDHHPGNRVAYVLNLTRSWKIDWGGLLIIESNPNSQPMIIPPRWNTLSLFRIPVNHTVSAVTQAASEHRYSITGWLRP